MRFGFLPFPDLEELDLVGPWEMVGMWAQIGGGPDERLSVAETGRARAVRQRCMRVVPQVTIAECPPLD
jgi:hypothetical protein